MIHHLKTAPKWFQQLAHNSKTFECRKNDRNFKENDILILKEWDNGYTGEEMCLIVTSIIYDYQFAGIAKGYCIMSVQEVKAINL